MESWIPDNSKIDEDKEGSPLIQELLKPVDTLVSEGSLFRFPSNRKGGSRPRSIIERRPDGLYTTNHMGWFSCGDTTVTIGSRFDGESDGKANNFFLIHMLSSVLGIEVTRLSLSSSIENQQNVLLELAFLRTVIDATQKGIIRTYTRREHNDSNVRGTLDLPRHIKLNTPFAGKAAYTTREYDADNPVTQLIRHCIEQFRLDCFSKDKTGNDVRKAIARVRECTQSYRQADLRRIIEYNKRHPVTHPYYSEYRLLQQLSLALLTHMTFDSTGKQNGLRGVVFDGAWLWEQYVAGLLRKGFDHPDNNTEEGTQYLFCTKDGNGEIPCYPDFISKPDSNKEEEQTVVADAKYKYGNECVISDYHQILAYMYRFNANLGLLLYPCMAGDASQEVFTLAAGVSSFRGQKGSLKVRDNAPCVCKLALQVPSSSECVSIIDYQKEFISQQEAFKESIKQITKTEIN